MKEYVVFTADLKQLYSLQISCVLLTSFTINYSKLSRNSLWLLLIMNCSFIEICSTELMIYIKVIYC